MTADRLKKYRQMLGLLAILLAVLVVYGRTLHVPWYLDDYVTIVNAPLIRDLRASFGALFAPRGVAIFTFALNHHFGGLAFPGYHLVNIAIHAVASCLTGLLLLRIVPGRPLLALLGALLFAVHPLQTQAVTYVTQRMTSLSALFILLAIYLYVRAREGRPAGGAGRELAHPGFYLGSLCAGALAIFTKENAVILPVLLFLFEIFFISAPAGKGWRRILPILPFLLAPVIYSCARFFIPLFTGTPLGALASYGDAAAPVSPLRYFVTELSVFWIYLRLFLLPYGQVIEYEYPVIAKWLTVQNLLAGAGLLVLVLIAWRVRRRRPLLSFGIAWFFAALAIESSFIPLDPIFEHRLYLPLFGLIVVLLGLTEFFPRPHPGVALLGVLVLLMAIIAWQRNLLWNDPVAFYATAVRAQPQNAKLLSELALARLERGETAGVEALLRRALELKPQDVISPRLVLFNLFLQQRRWDEAENLLFQTTRQGGNPRLIMEMRMRLNAARR